MRENTDQKKLRIWTLFTQWKQFTFYDLRIKMFLEYENFQKVFARITEQKMKFFIKDFFSKCDQIRRELRRWSHLLKKSLMENFIFCAVDLSALGKSIVFRVSGTLRNQFRVCASGGKNSLFFGKFGVFCFL